MTLQSSDHVVVVGAGLAGWHFCEELRRLGFQGRLSMVGDEQHFPYDRPPLSKQVASGKWTSDKTLLASPERRHAADIEWHLNDPATSLDVATSSVQLESGEVISGSHVVIASGVRARHLPVETAQTLVVRKIEDGDRLNRALDKQPPAEPVVVIGGGFIGAEVATAARSRGLSVVVLEAARRPLVNVFGVEVAGAISRATRQIGIEVRTGQEVQALVPDSHFTVVQLGDGSTIRTRLVVTGVGSVANVEWLSGSSVPLDGGVLVDQHFEVSSTLGAIGDVAKFPWRGEPVRFEHWQVARDSATALAQWWASGTSAAAIVPYFWSDQYSSKIQVLGRPRPDGDVTLVKGEWEEGAWVCLYSHDGIVDAVVSLNQPRALMLSRGLLEVETTLASALELAPWSG